MKKHMIFILAGILMTMSSLAQAELFCTARINKTGESTGDKVLEGNQNEGRNTLESKLHSYAIKVRELISKDPTNPTLELIVKSETGIILQTMMPSPGEQSGEVFVRTVLNVEEGIMTIKCLKH